jgi:hypothetical protein
MLGLPVTANEQHDDGNRVRRADGDKRIGDEQQMISVRASVGSR